MRRYQRIVFLVSCPLLGGWLGGCGDSTLPSDSPNSKGPEAATGYRSEALTSSSESPCGKGGGLSWKTCSEMPPQYEGRSKPYWRDASDRSVPPLYQDTAWNSVCVGGCTSQTLPTTDSFEIDNGGLKIASRRSEHVDSPTSQFRGAYFNKVVEGHFYAEVSFDPKEASGIALVRGKNLNGTWVPDTDNFTSLFFDRSDNGQPTFEVRDRQTVTKPDGSFEHVSDVLDNTGRIANPAGAFQEKTRRYRHVLSDQYAADLDGRNDYNVPFSETNGKMRIFFDRAAGFFHYYYGVQKNILGEAKPTQGWAELAPSRTWQIAETSEPQVFFVALLGKDYSDPTFSDLDVIQVPTEDLKDSDTGFRVTRREYNWSGFFGDAFVITFDKEFPYFQDRKLVFWSETNYVPTWHLNNQLLFSYEFIELWNRWENFYRGCAEPMSDRLRWHNYVKVVEDTAARKVLHWHYVLVNPAYQTFWSEHYGHYRNTKPESLPTGDEYWTVYPDGTVYRHVVYTPDKNATTLADPSFEVAEFLVIAGSSTHPYDHMASQVAPAELYDPKWNNGETAPVECNDGTARNAHLPPCPQTISLYNLDGKSEAPRGDFNFDYLSFIPHGEQNDAPHPSFPESKYNDKWGALAANNWDEVIALARFRNQWDAGSAPGPEPFMVFQRFNQRNRSSGDYPFIVDLSWHDYNHIFSHWPVGKEPFEYHDKNFADFRAQVSHSSLVSVQVNGGGKEPEPKEWVFMLGLSQPGNDKRVQDRARGWLHPADIATLGKHCSFSGANPYGGSLDFKLSSGSSCAFALKPNQNDTQIVNPVIQITDWDSIQPPTRVYLGSKPLAASEYRMSWNKNARTVLVWLKTTIMSPTQITIVGDPTTTNIPCEPGVSSSRCTNLADAIYLPKAPEALRLCSNYIATYGKPFLCHGAKLCRLITENPARRDDPRAFCVMPSPHDLFAPETAP